MDEEQEFLIGKLKAAIESVYGEKRPLLKFSEGDRTGLEQAFVFRIGIYLSKSLHGTKYESLDLDSEYTKNHGDPKRTINFPDGIRPDLIIHERDSNDENKLVAEFKGYWDNNIGGDLAKLADLTSPYDKYQYRIGVFVRLEKTEASFRYFVAGADVG